MEDKGELRRIKIGRILLVAGMLPVLVIKLGGLISAFVPKILQFGDPTPNVSSLDPQILAVSIFLLWLIAFIQTFRGSGMFRYVLTFGLVFTLFYSGRMMWDQLGSFSFDSLLFISAAIFHLILIYLLMLDNRVAEFLAFQRSRGGKFSVPSE